MTKGKIFNIEEFAVHDGPGIRKLVFFKGCPLQCTWCHNPEGISFKRELMFSAAACKHCGRCETVCEFAFQPDKCSTSGLCVKACPLRLRKIVGEEFDAKTLAKNLLKGSDVLINSGGGITISGGEPMAQPDFLLELIHELKAVHIAIETSGYAKPEIFNKIISEVDLVLMDIKHTDTEIHKKYTGVNNELILTNLKTLCASNTPFIIRIPLIPGVNDSLENMEQTALLLKNVSNLIEVELLPYHKTAPAKYAMVNREFNPGFDTEKEVTIHLEIFEKHNIRVKRL